MPDPTTADLSVLTPDVIHFNVTPDDIASGVRMSGDSCPIAHAICRAADIDADVIDVASKVYIFGHSYQMPDNALRFIELFDSDVAVEPFAADIVHEPDCHECACLCTEEARDA